MKEAQARFEHYLRRRFGQSSTLKHYRSDLNIFIDDLAPASWQANPVLREKQAAVNDAVLILDNMLTHTAGEPDVILDVVPATLGGLYNTALRSAYVSHSPSRSKTLRDSVNAIFHLLDACMRAKLNLAYVRGYANAGRHYDNPTP